MHIHAAVMREKSGSFRLETLTHEPPRANDLLNHEDID